MRNAFASLLSMLLVAPMLLSSCREAETATTVAYEEPAPDVTSIPRGAPLVAQLTDAPMVPHPIYRDAPARVIVKLEVTEVEKEIAPGVRYTMWTFGGSVPGKFIRVRQGDVVELHLQNHPSSKLPHNIDLHAVTGPGGGAEPTFTAPGHASQFTFRATNPGLYVYHCATAPVPMHVANGMYGLIFVEPPGGLPFVHHEYYVMQGELYTKGKYHEPGLQQFDMEKGIDEKPTYVLFNGAEGALAGPKALRAKAGEKVRLFIGNGGPNLVSSFHVIGEIFDRVYVEGGSKTQENVQTTLVPAGGSAIVEFTVDVPGTFLLVDHSLFRTFNKGALGTLVVEGVLPKDLYSGKQADRPYHGPELAGSVAVPQISMAPAGPLDDAQRLELGRQTYARLCAACHGPDGRGVTGTFPPVASSDYLAATSEDKLIGHIIGGLQGPIVVNGKGYNSIMPPMGFLADQEIAGVLTYVRGSFGNKLDKIAPQDVARVRGRMASQP